jgi:hypothetical protein
MVLLKNDVPQGVNHLFAAPLVARQDFVLSGSYVAAAHLPGIN